MTHEAQKPNPKERRNVNKSASHHTSNINSFTHTSTVASQNSVIPLRLSLTKHVWRLTLLLASICALWVWILGYERVIGGIWTLGTIVLFFLTFTVVSIHLLARELTSSLTSIAHNLLWIFMGRLILSVGFLAVGIWLSGKEGFVAFACIAITTQVVCLAYTIYSIQKVIKQHSPAKSSSSNLSIVCPAVAEEKAA